MFFGYFEHTLDEKNRVIIPAKMREEAGKTIYIMKGFDGALSIYKEESFKEMLDGYKKVSFNKSVARDFYRAILPSVCELDVDKIGRVQIPTTLINKYNIGKEVAIIGVGDHIEIWDKKAYEAYEERVNKEFENNAEKLDDDE